MISGKLTRTQPAYVTQSEIGCDYLDLKMELEGGEKLRISMPVEDMKLLGAMMLEVASRIENDKH